MKNNKAFEGFKNEKDFVINLNKNKNHKFWSTLGLNDNNKNLFFIKIEGKKTCILTNEKVLPKSDVYVAELDQTKSELNKNFYYSENSINNVKKIFLESGISIKMNGSNYQIDKCSINKFYKRFNSKELFVGATIYSKNLNDFKKNHNVIKNAKVNWIDIANYFNEKSLISVNEKTIFNEEHKNIFSRIQLLSYKKIKQLVIDNQSLLNAIFKGSGEFKKPYSAEWILSDGFLTKKIITDFYVTKGSSNGGKNPTVVFKPLRKSL